MAGQIVKRGEGTWVVRIFLGRDGGKRRYMNRTVHGTKKDAERVRTALMRERDLGTLAEPCRLSLNDFLDQWLEKSARPRVRERTYTDYVGLLNYYVRPKLGGRQLAKLTPLDIQGLYAAMQSEGASKRKPKGLSARTVRYCHAVLRSALGQAVKWGMIQSNPAELVDLPRQERREYVVLTKEQAAQFLSYVRGKKYGIAFELALSTGMRPEEYLGLRWRDVDLKKGSVTIQKVLTYTKKPWKLTDPKTTKSRRTIPLPASTVAALKAHRVAQAKDRLSYKGEYHDHGFVVAQPNGEPMQAAVLRRVHFRPALEKLEFPTALRLYDLRHTCASLLLEAGENPKTISERLGHASVVLTLDVYSHLMPNAQRTASDRLEGILYSQGEAEEADSRS